LTIVNKKIVRAIYIFYSQITNLNELYNLSFRWWEKLGIKEDLCFARNRLVESFMCASGVAFEAKYKSLRKWLTKVITFVLVIDDVYDIHASFEELNPFTTAFHRFVFSQTIYKLMLTNTSLRFFRLRYFMENFSAHILFKYLLVHWMWIILIDS
jgi:hypothetical protein